MSNRPHVDASADNENSENSVNNNLLECNNGFDATPLHMSKEIEENMIVSDDVNIRSTSNKRGRDSDDEERWLLIGRNGKRTSQKIDIYISCFEKLPKQFALAKLLKSHNIEKICRVKYINPYKIFIQFECATSAEKIMNCKPLQDLGWRFQKPLEVATSYGVIKNMEVDLSEKELFEVITCSSELTAVKRLKRRSKDRNGWEDSESVRLGFKGSLLPAYVYIHNMKIKVEPYVFPVTQCSNCWKFGHSVRVCPSTKIVCPKCKKNHDNCETTIFKCVNCNGNHLSLDRSCPAFKKEKKLRELMAEFNCSYRKALQMYVPPECPVQPPTELQPADINEKAYEPASTKAQDAMTYAEAAKVKSSSKGHISSDRNIKLVNRNIYEYTGDRRKKKNSTTLKDKEQEATNWTVTSESEAEKDMNSNESEDERRREKERREEYKHKISFRHLISKLCSIFHTSQGVFKDKIVQGVTLFIEWLIPTVGKYMWDLPLNTMFSK